MQSSAKKPAIGESERDFELQGDVYFIQELLATGILDNPQANGPLVMAALTYLLVLVRDLLAKLDKHNMRVSIACGPGRDITDLITDARNAACHIPSKLSSTAEGHRFICVMMERQGGDPLFCFGDLEIAVQEHIVPAFEAAKKKIAQISPSLAHTMHGISLASKIPNR